MRPTFRLLPLSLCIALALPAMAADNEPEDFRLCPIRDSVPAFEDAQAPVGDADTRTQQPTDIEGDELQGQGERSTLVQGNVRLQRGDQFLGTDRLTFDSETGDYTAEGSVRYQDSGMRIVAERAEGNQEADTHRITDLRYQLTERRGSGGADRIELKGEHGALVGATYSTCDPAQRVWELEADRIDIDTEEGLGVARGAKVRIGNVPVLYVPWFMFPIDDRRRTGLLYPSIALSGRNGFDWRQPIYFNLAPNYDATLYPRFMSERGALLGGEFRWLYPQGQGTVAATFMPDDRLPENEPDRYLVRDSAGNLVRDPNPPDSDRGQFALNALHTLGSKWYATANLGWVSDTHYLEDFSNSLYGVASYYIRSDVGAYGRGRNWEASITADHYQLSDYTLTEANLPFDRLPRAFAHWAQPFAGNLFEVGLDGEAVRFEHEIFDAGSRIDLKPYATMSLEGAAWFVQPKVAWRYTGYDLEPGRARDIAVYRAAEFYGVSTAGSSSDVAARLTADQIEGFYDASPSRSLPIASVDMGAYFDRSTTIRGEHYLHTLEPRLYYLRVPYEEQDDLPLFDTAPMTFSWGQLFRDNRYTGPDRQTDANQLTVALTTRLISEDDGRERLAASIGQIRYFDDSRVTPGIGPGVAVERGRSAWVADVGVSPNDRWTINAAYQWDPKFRREDLASLRARYLFGDTGIVNIGYRYRRDLLEQVDFSFVYPFHRNWSLVGRYYYSLLEAPGVEAGPLETIAGVQWESCCLAVRLLSRRYLRDRSGDLNESLRLEVELKGLGSAGQKTERVLRRAILGYDRDDLYLVPPSSVNRPGVDGTADPSSDPTL